MVRVGINGFGRIGRNFLRSVLATRADVEVVAINDITSVEINAHLLRFDSTHGRLSEPVSVDGDQLIVGSRPIRVFAEREPAKLPWAELGVSVVIESTGRFTTGRRRRATSRAAPRGSSSPRRPRGGRDVRRGRQRRRVRPFPAHRDLQRLVHHQLFRAHDQGARRRLWDRFGPSTCTAVHVYTNDQNLLDLAHRDPRASSRRGSTSSRPPRARRLATALVLTAMEGRLDGTALRVPVPDGSLTDATVVVKGWAKRPPGEDAAFGEGRPARPARTGCPLTGTTWCRTSRSGARVVYIRRRFDHGAANRRRRPW